MSHTEIQNWLATFNLDEFLRDHLADVMAALPGLVREDLVGDPNFRLADYEPGAHAFHVPVGLPGRNRSSRSVVLKRSLRRRPQAFVRYVIAHELAHAHLRNAGRWPGEDPELAADALAAEWGYPRVPWSA